MAAGPNNLFETPAPTSGEKASPFSSPVDQNVAVAVTDLLAEGDDYNLPDLHALESNFERAGIGQEFESWCMRRDSLPVSSVKLNKALGEEVVLEIARRAGLAENETLNRLVAVLPKVVEEITPYGPDQTPRTYRFHLEALRKRLR